MLAKLFLFFLWVILLPLLTGCSWSEKHKTHRGSLFLSYFYGIFIEFALFEILAVPMIFLKASLRQLSYSWLIVSLVLSVFSVMRGHAFSSARKKLAAFAEHKAGRGKRRVPVLLAAALICIFLQAGFVALNQHIDDDDAFYTATASTAAETDTLMEYNPYTGELYQKLPARYVLAAWPLYFAVLSTLTGFHPTVIAHLLLPAFAVLLAYLIYALIAEDLFPRASHQRDFFLLLIVLILGFSGFSIYTSGTFLLIRGWQGKALVAGVIQPALFYLCRYVMKEQGGWEAWAALFCVAVSACMFSSMGILLSIIPIGVYAVSYAFSLRRWRVLPCACASCAGAAAYGLAYIYLSSV